MSIRDLWGLLAPVGPQRVDDWGEAISDAVDGLSVVQGPYLENLTAWDPLDAETGSIDTRVLPSGQTWSLDEGSLDFQPGGYLSGNVGYAAFDLAEVDQYAQLWVDEPANRRGGLLLRYINPENCIKVVITNNNVMRLTVRVDGVVSDLVSASTWDMEDLPSFYLLRAWVVDDRLQAEVVGAAAGSVTLDSAAMTALGTATGVGIVATRSGSSNKRFTHFAAGPATLGGS